jgi:acetyltransferase-like isoleucine patch superfamily enzyme
MKTTKIINLLKLIHKVSILKSIYYSYKFNGKILIGKNCRINIYKNGKILFKDKYSSLYIGVHFSQAQGATLDIYPDGILEVGKSVGIYRGTKVVVREKAKLTIGDNTFVNENSRIYCHLNIVIGKSTSIAWCCTIIDSDLHGIYVKGVLTNRNRRVIIGDNVWICSNTTITKGVVILNNCIVGANSVVGRSDNELESNSIYAGNPIKFIKNFDSWGSF